MSNNNQPAFYDLDQIKQIPIIEVCRGLLGIECITRAGKTWCKTHPERTPSTLLHEDRNTFYDFGTHRHGDVVELVSYVMDIEPKDAIKVLADAYDIPALDQRKGLNANELSLWEYAKIGLYGDMATKNFEFNMDRLPIQKAYELSQLYSIPMNDLRKKYPKMYEQVLRRKALPYVRSLRNEYFLELWSQYQTMCHLGNPGLFYQPENLAVFNAQIKQLTDAERVLSRSVRGTSIELRPTREYDPAKDLSLLSEGKIKPVLGTASYDEMQAAAKQADCAVKYRPVNYDQYALHMMCDADDLFYSAFLQAGRVVIGYLEADKEKFYPYFNKMRTSRSKTAAEENEKPSEQPKAPVHNKAQSDLER